VGGIDRPCPASVLTTSRFSDITLCIRNSLISFVRSSSCISIHSFGLFISSQFPYLLVSFPHGYIASSSGSVTFAVRYSYDTSFHILYHSLLPPPSPPPPLTVCTGACVRRALVACTDTGLLTVSAVPAVALAILPFGVERRVCCGGERGSAQSVGLNVRCACVFLYVVYACACCRDGFDRFYLGCGGLFFDWKFSICTVWRSLIYRTDCLCK
jgi:hypothetical protein